MSQTASDTRSRIIDAALALFAERGFRGTTVGDIETAAGLVPRSGTFYHHFENKQAVLDAATGYLVEQLAAEAAEAMNVLPVGDLRSELLVIGKIMLALLQQNRALTRLLEKEGDSLPEFRDRLREELVNDAWRQSAAVIRDRLGDRADRFDLDAVFAVLGGAITNYRRNEWTLGGPPLDIPEDRYLEVWVDLALAYLGTDGS